MRNPNGYGSVIRLGGKRRKPFAVRITTAYELDADTSCARQKYKYLGYYAKRAEAMRALAEYNANPYDASVAGMTLSQVYDHWLPTRSGGQSHSMLYVVDAARRLLEPIALMPMRDIRLVHLQRVFDESGKTALSLEPLKGVAIRLFEYAIKNDICEKNYAQYIDLAHAKESQAKPHEVFTRQDIDALWARARTDDTARIILMLIYTGVRVSELLELKKDHLNLAGRYFEITRSKTSAGLRRVPIARKILPFFEYWEQKSDSAWLLTRQGRPMLYNTFLKRDWKATLTALGLEHHRPHDTRHTCISLLSMARVQPELIRAIVGHKGQNLTEDVYTHFDFALLLNAIDQI